MKYDVTVFVGRFQPFHQGHLFNVQQALDVSERLIIAIGSADRARTIKNPFSYRQRKAMILADLQSQQIDLQRISVVPVVDYFYEENAWEDDVKKMVSLHTDPQDTIAIIGHDKDDSSYYLKSFPQWGFVATENYEGLNATDLRKALWQMNLHHIMPYLVDSKHSNSTRSFLDQFIVTEDFSRLVDEFNAISDYKKAWANAPYDPVFVTVDAMVVYKNDILLIKRAQSPGKGFWALPGGFLDQGEPIKTGILRELAEETQITVSSDHLQQSCVTTAVFDYPGRSPRGRTITHVGLFELSDCPQKPAIKAADDAVQAQWFNLDDLHPLAPDLMDDHYQIIVYLYKHFLNKKKLKRLKK